MDVPLDSQFDLLDSLQSSIPASLQFVGYQTVLRIRSIVLLLGTLRRIVRRFQVSSPGVQDVVLLTGFFFARQCRRFHCCRLHHAQHLFGDSFVYRHSAECNTTRLSTVEPASMTYITEYIVVVASVQHGELTTTPPATQQTGQQSRTALHGARWSAPANIFRDRLLNLLMLFPAHVTFMGVRKQCQPLLPRFASSASARLAVFIAQCVFCFSVCIGAAVNRVGQNSVDRSVGRAFPTGLALPGIYRKLQTVFQQPQQGLTNRTEFEKFTKYQQRSEE